MKTKEQKLLEAAQELARAAETWADLSNALFDPEEGLLAKAFRRREDREKFVKTKEYKAIRQLVNDAKDRTGLVEGATPKQKSGKFMVRLPKTLHAALEAEAADEGVSLNQLVVTKLAMSLSKMAVA
jgi:predicted HicB family RNase H-like nuclease